MAKFKKVRSLRDIELDPRVASVDHHDEGISVWLTYGWCNWTEAGTDEQHSDCVHSIAEDTVTQLKRAFNLFVTECNCTDRCE